MKELEILQHVINGVEIEILNYKSDYVGIQYAKTNGYYYLSNDLYITYEGGSTGKFLDSCRLILRPLSDLTNENTIEFYKLDSIDLELIDINEWTEELINMIIYNDKFQLIQFDYLFKNHFDVFGLIDKGLAIDINTLNK